ncbi:hypothetical protein ACJX0J_021604 [Zea mays]
MGPVFIDVDMALINRREFGIHKGQEEESANLLGIVRDDFFHQILKIVVTFKFFRMASLTLIFALDVTSYLTILFIAGDSVTVLQNHFNIMQIWTENHPHIQQNHIYCLFNHFSF